MSRMVVNQQACVLCGACVDACPFGACEIAEQQQVVFLETCRLCRACIDACPQEAISMEADTSTQVSAEASDQAAKLATDLAKYAGVLVFVEQRNGQIQPVSYEMIGKGLQLAQTLQQPLACVLAGENILDQAKDLLWYGVDTVYYFDHPELCHFRIEPYTNAFVSIVEEMRPSIVLVGATHVGRSLAPRVATRLRTGLTADCTSLEIGDNGLLVQTRPAFGGNVMASILTPNHRPQMATVRYKVMAPANRRDTAHGQILKRELPAEALQSAIKQIEISRRAQVASITQADVIVAAGRGVASASGLALVKELADSLGGLVACTRPLVEQGLFTHAQQVGLSGRTVRPKLYVACGISGAVQHVAGMSGSDTIIAINRDANAPIFDVAHVAIVGDALSILPNLIDRIKSAHPSEVAG